MAITVDDMYHAGCDIIQNLGSDATPETVNRALEERFPECTFTVEMSGEHLMDITCFLPLDINEIEMEISM